MSAHQAVFPIAAMARVLGVSRAGYYAWLEREPSARARSDEALLKRIRTVHTVSRGTYGAPRIHAELKAAKENVGRKRIARLMRKAALAGVSRRRGPVTTRRQGLGMLKALECSRSSRSRDNCGLRFIAIGAFTCGGMLKLIIIRLDRQPYSM
jgi:putative transposase